MNITRFFVISFCFVLFIGFVAANDILTLRFSVNEPLLSFSVQEDFDLGSVTVGFDTALEASRQVEINNTGDLDIIIFAEALSDSDIVDYIRLGRVQSEISPISKFNMSIARPSGQGGVRSDSFYVQIDLTDYNGEMEEIAGDYEIDILFIAMPG